MRRGTVSLAVGALLIAGCGDDQENSTDVGGPPLRSPAQVGAFQLKPVAEEGDQDPGTATVRKQGGAGGLALTVTADLPPSERNEAYEVWVYNNKGDAEVTWRSGDRQERRVHWGRATAV